jgi:hypothetical protein
MGAALPRDGDELKPEKPRLENPPSRLANPPPENPE